jgi:peptide/nickel transport system permease protein
MFSLVDKALLTDSWQVTLIPDIFPVSLPICLSNIGNYLRKSANRK